MCTLPLSVYSVDHFLVVASINTEHIPQLLRNRHDGKTEKLDLTLFTREDISVLFKDTNV